MESKTILLTNHYGKNAYGFLERALPAGFEIRQLNDVSRKALLSEVNLADYLIVSGRLRIDEEVLEHATKLKMVARTGVGLDTLDLTTLKKRNIPLYVNAGVNAESVAEHTVLLILAALRQLPIADSRTKSGIWIKQEHGVMTHELFGKTVCIIGAGKIGQLVASLLQPFKCQILLLGRQNRENLKEAFSVADIITLHCPLTSETAQMINSNTISYMKLKPIIINTSRGGLIDEAALAKALQEKSLSFAGLDVFVDEPIKLTSPLCELDNIIMTPHIGGITAESFESMIQNAIYNIVCFDQGKYCDIQDSEYELGEW
jgi:D-3-phosphoglycerate dehydrogenase